MSNLTQKDKLLTLFKDEVDPVLAGELLDIFARQAYLQGYGDAIAVITSADLSGKPLSVLLEEKLREKK